MKFTILSAFIFAIACSSTTQPVNDEEKEIEKKTIDIEPVTVGATLEGGSFDDFENRENPDKAWKPVTGDFAMRDVQTGSLWNIRGEAFEGPLAGQRLKQIPAFNSFWFAWSIFYDGSELWNRDETNSPGELQKDDACEVPCNEIVQGCGGGLDCIPALDFDGTQERPVAEMVSADDNGANYLSANDYILGVVIDGEARAYPHNILWWHEIYNDKINDTEFTITFCPLTGSGIAFAGELDGEPIDFGVSGNLYNSNLVMFDRQSQTFWSQMIFTAVTGEKKGASLRLLPIVETTWARWKEMYPDTKVASDSQGHSRDYGSYPYGSYREDHNNTFRATNPRMEDFYLAKNRVLGIPSGDALETDRAYAMAEMEETGDRVVVNDRPGERAIVVIYEAEHRLALPFEAQIDGRILTFEGVKAP